MTDRREEAAPPAQDSASPDGSIPEKSTRALNVVLVIGSIVVSLVLAELGARLYGVVRDDPHTSSYDFRVTRPLPYKDSAFFSKRFMEEQRRAPGGYSRMVGTDIIIPNDFQGAFYNVVDGLRRTTDQPLAPKRRILLFGGSTMYAAEVPDGFTIASSLQRLVNHAFAGEYQVLNFGVDAADAHQELARLRTVDVRADDVVVFYDGFNEAYNGVYLNNLGGTMYDAIYDAYHGSSVYARALYRLNNQLRNRSALVRRFFTASPRMPDHMKDPAIVDDLAKRTDDAYKRILEEAHEYTSSKGARFVHFLQPHLFSKPSVTSYETGLVQNHYLVPPGIERSMRATYSLFKETVRKLQEADIRSFDLSSVLDDRSSPEEEFYFDFVHVNDKANARLAGAMLDGLRPSLSPRR